MKDFVRKAAAFTVLAALVAAIGCKPAVSVAQQTHILPISPYSAK